MKHVNLLIKPSSSLCNMRCAYCFYTDESERRTQKSMGLMSWETADQLIEAAFSAVERLGSVSFSFQGGEPTLAGLDFFRHFTEKVRWRNRDHLSVAYAIQTNGLCLTEEWAAFFRENRFLVGISVDGDRAIHDRFRKDAEGHDTFERVSAHVEMLLKNRVDTNILCVVNGQTAEKPRRVYRALKSLNTGYLQFIPCLDPLGSPRGSMPWSLSAEAYGRFLCGVFDEWYTDWRQGRYVSVRQFDDWVHVAMGLPPGMCATCGQCGGYLVAEADGSLYPCDFYALDEWKLGTVRDGLENVFRSEKMAAFCRRSTVKPPDCAACTFKRLCRGGCPRDWEERDGKTINTLCPALRTMFSRNMGRILEIAREEIIAGWQV